MAKAKKSTKSGPLEGMTCREKALTIAAPVLEVEKIKAETDYLAVAGYVKTIKALQGALAEKHEEVQEDVIRPLRAVIENLYDKHRASKRSLQEAEGRALGLLNAYAASKKTKAITAAKKKATKAPNKEIGRELIEAASEEIHVPKIAGVSYRTEYTFKITDRDAVPIAINSVELRPIHEPAIKKLVKATKGSIEIPGIAVTVIDGARVK